MPRPRSLRRRRAARLRTGLAAVALTTGLPAVATGILTPATAEASAAPQEFAWYTALDRFYERPALPSPAPAPGTLIRYQQANGSKYRIMYWTQQTIHEGGVTKVHTVPATAMVNRPKDPRPAGGYPYMVWNHGTTGMVPACGPSRDSGDVQWDDWLSPAAWTVAPDYVGLGVDAGFRSSEANHQFVSGTGTMKPFDATSHPYLSVEGEGRATLDAIRATRALDGVFSPGANLGKPRALLVGLSQGGHAALAAAEVHTAGYAKADLDIAAVVAGAPASDVDFAEYDPEVRSQLAGRLVGALSVEHRDLKPTAVLSSQGKWGYGAGFDAGCGTDWWTAFAKLFEYESVQPHIAYGDLTDPAKQPAVAKAIAAARIGNRTVAPPVFIAQVSGDPVVQPAATTRLVTRLRSRGTQVTYCTYTGVSGSPLWRGLNHNAAVDKALDTTGTCTGSPDPDITHPKLDQWLAFKKVAFRKP